MDTGLIFSGRIEMVLLIILLIVTGSILCFLGYKYFRLIIFGTVCGWICFLGYQLSKRLAGNLSIRLILCVAVSFLGICLVYFAAVILNFLLEKIKIKRFMTRRTYIVSAVLGAIVLAFTVYYGIYHSRTAAVLTALVGGGSGFTVQHKKKEKHIRFKTYDDLLRLHPLEESGGDE